MLPERAASGEQLQVLAGSSSRSVHQVEVHSQALPVIAEAGARPWFLMANAHDPHRPFHGSADEVSTWSEEQRSGIPMPSRVWSAHEAPVPGFLPSGVDAVATEFAQYLSSVRRCDDVVGAVLAALDASGQAEKTLVIFLSDNGMAFPFAKANCYLQSTRTPLILRWPRHISPGTVDESSLVSSLDFFPTICRAAGITPADDLDGVSLQELLEDGAPLDRDMMFTVFHETSGKRRFEMRCAQDSDWGYIWNQWADGRTEYKAENMQGLTWPGMIQAADGSDEIARRNDFYLVRAPEELYDLRADPHSLENLATDPKYADRLATMRTRMHDWMVEHGDPQLKTYRSHVIEGG